MDFLRYRYRLAGYERFGIDGSPEEVAGGNESVIETTLGETLGVFPQAASDEPIMMLGCGNSKFGEDMVEAGWRGPLIQVDIASRVIESMSLRCAKYQKVGDMQLVQDDATVLSAFNDDKLAAVFDKGLIDALFCTDDHEQCYDAMQSVHRVLLPGSCFVVLSFSRPEFSMEKLGVPPSGMRSRAKNRRWADIQIRELDNILMYRFQKGSGEERLGRTGSSRRRR